MVTIKITYPENADLEEFAKTEEEFAKYMESMGAKVEFKGTLPRPRRPKTD